MSQQAVNAQIMGQSYVLSAPSEEVSDLRTAIGRVDEAMCRIRDAGKIKARDRIAVLAALQIAFDSRQLAQNTAEPAALPASLPVALPSAQAHSSAHSSADTLSNLPPDLQDNDSRLATLIYKLDQALGRDGRLL